AYTVAELCRSITREATPANRGVVVLQLAPPSVLLRTPCEGLDMKIRLEFCGSIAIARTSLMPEVSPEFIQVLPPSLLLKIPPGPKAIEGKAPTYIVEGVSGSRATEVNATARKFRVVQLAP